jgi:hypothetical protein
MTFTNIDIQANGGPVTINVAIARQPQNLVAVLKRFNSLTKKFEVVGVFNSDQAQLTLGMPQNLVGTIFIVRGLVTFLGDSRPSAYEVVVDILQNGQSFFKEVPQPGGSGILTDSDIAFVYGFKPNIR